MMRLFAKVLMLVGCLTISTQLLALGLGELKLHSALNQPLDAEIELVDAEGLSQWEIKPFLASSVAFERAGVERPYFLTKMRFKVEGESIRLTTKDPVTEPFLNFLIELNWPSGRVLREYTVLLDPPTFAEDNYQPLATAPSSAPMQTTEFQGGSNQPYSAPRQRQIPPAPGARASAAPTRRDVEVNEAGQETYQVKPNDTLWSIALRTRPSSRVTPQQMMVAIQGENPDAFIAGNINRLKTHHVLRIPEQDQVSGVSFESAVSEVARQNQDAGLGGAQLDATGRDFSTGPDQSEQSGGEIKLVSAQAREARSAGASGDVTRGSGGRQEALENELAISLENLDKSQRENKELRERLADLSEQIDGMQRLISLKDSQLASMQATTAQQNQQVEGSAVPETVTPETVASSSVDAATPASATVDSAAVGESASAPVAAVEPKPVEPQPAPRKFVPPPPPPPPPSFIDSLLADTVTLAGGLAALLLLAGLSVLYLRKRKEADADDTSSVDESAIAEPISLDDAESPERAAAPDEQGFNDLNNFDFDTEVEGSENNDLMADVDLGGDLFADPTAVNVDNLNVAEPAADIEDDGVDVSGLDFGDEEDDLFELVDLDVAYGRFDDAVERLQGALEIQPGRSDVRLRLLELLVEMGDADRFVEQENAVIESGDPELTQQASDLRQLLSDPVEPTALAPAAMGAAVVGAAAMGAAAHDVASDIDISIDQMGGDLDDGVAFGDALDISDNDPQAGDFDFEEEGSDSADTVTASDDELLDLDSLEAELEEDFESASASDVDEEQEGEQVEFDLSSLAEQLDDDESVEELPQEEDTLDDDNLMDFDLEAFEELEEAPVEESADSEDLFDEESSMDFDVAELSLPSEEEAAEKPAVPGDDDNAMDFDVAELSLPSEEDVAEESTALEDDENTMEFDLSGLEDSTVGASEDVLDDVEDVPDNLLEFEAEDVVSDTADNDSAVADETLNFDEDSQVDFDLGELDSELEELSVDTDDKPVQGESTEEVLEETSLDSLAEAEDSLEALMDADGDEHGEFDLAGLQSEYTADGDVEEATLLGNLESLDDLAALDSALSDSEETLEALPELEELESLDDLDDLESLDALEALPELESVEDADDDLAALDTALSDSEETLEALPELDELESLDDLESLDELEALPELESVDVESDDLAALDDSEESLEALPELDELESLDDLESLEELEALPELASVESADDDLAALDTALSDSEETLEALPELDELEGLDELEALPELASVEGADDDLAALDTALSDSEETLEALPELDDLEALPELEPLTESIDSPVADNALPELSDFEPLPELGPETAVVAAAATVAAVAATRTNDIDLDALAQSDDEFDFLSGTDECDTKLELAQEYLNMDDEDGARELLSEVVSEGTDAQVKQARELLDTFA